MGIPVPNSENKIIDTETGDEIEISAEGESAPGELLVRGPNVMAGYLGNEEATAATIEPDGFLHTGDIAVVRADGVVTIVTGSRSSSSTRATRCRPRSWRHCC